MSLTLKITPVKNTHGTETGTTTAMDQTNAATISATTPITIYNPPEALNAGDNRNKMIMVTILPKSGQATAIKISRKATVGHLQQIWHRVKSGDAKVKDGGFFFEGRLLECVKRLDVYGIEDGDTILAGRPFELFKRGRDVGIA